MAYKHFNVVTDGDSAITFVNFDREGQSVNTFNKEAMYELEQIVDGLSKSDACRGIVFASSKSSWIAGADISEFFALFDADDNVVLDVVKKGHEVFNKIEDLDIPTIALINGAAMGGGTELALACTFRVACDMDSFQIALPETKLGILPAWGGTTRLPRLLGADHAIDLICSGRSVRKDEALKLGLVDAIYSDHMDKMLFLNDMITTANEHGHINKVRDKKTGPIKLNMIESMMTFKFAGAQVKKKAGKNYPAPVRALEVMEECKKMKRDEALESESLAFLELIKTDVAKNLINLFVNERKLKAEADKLDAHSLMNITVLGAGIMGSGIAFAIANKTGKKVTLYDPYQTSLDKARKSNRDYLMKKVSKKYIDMDELNRVMDLISESRDLAEAVGDADMVIEAIPEDLGLKQKAFNEVDNIVGSQCILATNTSTFTVNDVFEYVRDKKRCVGMHFFNPVGKMPLVEVVKGPETSDSSLGSTATLAKGMGKTPLITGDCAGFVVNRILLPYLMSADQLISHGHDMEYVDKTMKSYGWPMGPFELLDVIGIDTAVHCVDSFMNAYPHLNEKFTGLDHSEITRLFNEKHLGQKTSAGFYSWKGTKKLDRFVVNKDSDVKPMSAKEIEDFLMGAMIEEAKKVVEEGIVDEEWKVNIAMIMGAAFPPYKGGIL
jgi:3-hydroxyacyl-CoA dehydrogenase/enoyl-CoA hydratase/3-hydroxybutyryl-CoA epimerase/enoyl-CoA isomerase